MVDIFFLRCSIAGDLAYFNIEVMDEKGLLAPDAEVPVAFTIEGKCQLQAVGNGNTTDMKSLRQPSVVTFKGRAQVIVRSGQGKEGISVKASSKGLKIGEASVLAH